MLRKDGKSVFYRLVHRRPGTKKWHSSNVISFIDRLPTEVKYESDELRMRGIKLKCIDAFDASGECWQQLGYHGVLDKALGREALAIFSQNFKGTQFGLQRVTITQETKIVYTDTTNG